MENPHELSLTSPVQTLLVSWLASCPHSSTLVFSCLKQQSHFLSGYNSVLPKKEI
jgi:hypothetical protein